MLHPPPPQIPSTLTISLSTAAVLFSIQTAAQAKILGVPLCSSLLTTLQMVQCQVLSTLPSGYALKLTTAPWVSRSRHLLPSPNYLMISYQISMLSPSPYWSQSGPLWSTQSMSLNHSHFQRLPMTSRMKYTHRPMTLSSLSSGVRQLSNYFVLFQPLWLSYCPIQRPLDIEHLTSDYRDWGTEFLILFNFH